MVYRYKLSRFDPHPQRLPIFYLILGGRSESLPRKPGFPYYGSDNFGNCSGSRFFPNQILLSKNVRSSPSCRQKSLLRKSGIGGGFQNLVLKNTPHEYQPVSGSPPPPNCSSSSLKNIAYPCGPFPYKLVRVSGFPIISSDRSVSIRSNKCVVNIAVGSGII